MKKQQNMTPRMTSGYSRSFFGIHFNPFEFFVPFLSLDFIKSSFSMLWSFSDTLSPRGFINKVKC